MKNKHFHKSGQAFSRICILILVVFFIVCMLSQPAKFIQQSLNGLTAWATNILPSVLPFMFFTKVLSALDIMPTLTRPFSPITQKFFKTPPISIYTFAMAVLSGYPVGSKMVADLYLQGKITKSDAFKMSSFCSTSGPMFIIGAVGIGMFHNSKIGYILFASHLIGSILNGILFRNLKAKDEQPLPTSNENNKKSAINLADIVTSSTLSILSVGCIITIFFIVIACFEPLLSLLPQSFAFFLEGIIEITKGCLDISTLSNVNLAIILASFIISFGGISTILQSITMLSSVKMPIKLFVLQKLCHGFLSALVTAAIIFLI